MSCRSTPGGRAASAAACAISGRSADDASRLVHRIRREYRRDLTYNVQPATLTDVTETLEHLGMQVRHTTGITENRRNRTLAKITDALTAYQTGTADLPTNETVQAWRDLPARLETLPPTDQPRNHGQPTPADQPPPPYHKRFRHFSADTVTATDLLFSARPSQLSHEQRDEVFRNWLNTISAIYQMDPPTFRWDESADYGGGGFYRRDDHSITMSPNHPSVVTLIHETRHALQHARKGAPMVSPDVEVDARAWSLSLYYRTRPRLFEQLVRQGRIFHITADEL